MSKDIINKNIISPFDSDKNGNLNANEIDNLLDSKETTKKIREKFVNDLKTAGDKVKTGKASKEEIKYLYKILVQLENARENYEGIKGIFKSQAKDKIVALSNLLTEIKDIKEGVNTKVLEMGIDDKKIKLEKKVNKRYANDNTESHDVYLGKDSKGYYLEIEDFGGHTFIYLGNNYPDNTNIKQALKLYEDTENIGGLREEKYEIKKGELKEVNGKETEVLTEDNIKQQIKDSISKKGHIDDRTQKKLVSFLNLNGNPKSINEIKQQIFTSFYNYYQNKVNPESKGKEFFKLIIDVGNIISVKFDPDGWDKSTGGLSSIPKTEVIDPYTFNALQTYGIITQKGDLYYGLINELNQKLGSQNPINLKKDEAKLKQKDKIVSTTNDTEKRDGKEVKEKLLTTKEKIDLLSSGNVSSIDAKNLKNAITKAIAHEKGDSKDTKINSVYERITGKKPDWSNNEKAKVSAENFTRSLNISLTFIKQLTGGNAGLHALLEGKSKEFIDLVIKEKSKNPTKPIPVELKGNSEEMSPWVHNILGALLTTGIAILSKGMIIAGTEKYIIDADEVIGKIKANEKGELGSKATDVLSWIKDAIMGRRLSLNIGKDELDDMTKNIHEYTKKVMAVKNVDEIKNIKDAKVKESYAEVVNSAKNMKVDLKDPKNFEVAQKALIQSYIIGEGYKNKGTSWFGNIGLLMPIGLHYNNIDAKSLETKESIYTNLEKDATRKSLDKNQINSSGIKIERISDKKWKYTIPKNIKLPGSEEDGVETNIKNIKNFKEEKGNYIILFDKPQELTISEIGGKCDINFKNSNKNTVSIETKTQENKEAEKFRNEINKTTYKLMYFIGHSPNPKFKELISLLAKQDFSGAKDLLHKMEKGKYKTLAKNLLSDAANINIWLSYTYGFNLSRNKGEYNQHYIDKNIRTKAVMKAEEKLLKDAGISATKSEQEFALKDEKQKIEGKHASEVYPGQEMTLAVLSTPAIKKENNKIVKGAHRIDTYDGSVTISPKTVEITNNKEKLDIINTISNSTALEKGINAQFKKFKTWLESSTKNINPAIDLSKINLNNYKKYLAGDDISVFGIENLKLQPGKDTKVFEGRAMISGNVCFNRLYGITYPAFSFENKIQTVESPVSHEYTTPLNNTKLTTKRGDIGINTIGVLGQFGGGKGGLNLNGSGPGQGGGNDATPINNPIINNLGES